MRIQLTISLLVSDRMETLGKCLNSLKPLLRELDTELIVVFTGKSDETLALAQKYTVRTCRRTVQKSTDKWTKSLIFKMN